MKKAKILSILAVFLLGLLFLSACGDDNDTEPTANDNQPPVTDNNGSDNSDSDVGLGDDSLLPPMTTDEITLTFAAWENHYMMEWMAQGFMDRHPNITVEVIWMYLPEYNAGLFNLASAGELPDVFWYLGDITVPLENYWLRDFSEFFDIDPESALFPESLAAAGTIGDLRVSAPSKVLPFAFFLDRSVFERANVPMPSADWTWSEMLDLAREMTIPEQQIFGLNTFTQLITTSPIVNQDAIGEFGWNGYEFDFSVFADAFEQQLEFIRTGVFPPPYGEERVAAFGDPYIWPAATGQLAMQKDAIWTDNYFRTPAFVDRGIDFVIYPMPRGDNALTDNKPAFVDFGGISSATPHPREAYELLKWMGWGADGWMHRMEGFRTLENHEGDLLFQAPDGIPVLQNPAVWEVYRALVPQTDAWSAFLDSVQSPVPMGATYIPGFQAFLNWMGEQDIWGQMDRGEVRVHDIQDHITENANRFVREAMERVLSIYEQ